MSSQNKLNKYNQKLLSIQTGGAARAPTGRDLLHVSEIYIRNPTIANLAAFHNILQHTDPFEEDYYTGGAFSITAVHAILSSSIYLPNKVASDQVLNDMLGRVRVLHAPAVLPGIINKPIYMMYTTLFTDAVNYGNLHIIQTLIAMGANVNYCTYDGSGIRSSPLKAAVNHNNDAMFQLLLANGARPTFTTDEGRVIDYSYNLLISAMQQYNSIIVRLILAIPVALFGNELFLLTESSFIIYRDALLLPDGNPNIPAIVTEIRQIIAELRARGIDINAQNTDGETVLHLAAINNDIPLAMALHASGINVQILDNKAGAHRTAIAVGTNLAGTDTNYNVAILQYLV